MYLKSLIIYISSSNIQKGVQSLFTNNVFLNAKPKNSKMINCFGNGLGLKYCILDNNNSFVCIQKEAKLKSDKTEFLYRSYLHWRFMFLVVPGILLITSKKLAR